MTKDELRKLILYYITTGATHRHDCDECNNAADKAMVAVDSYQKHRDEERIKKMRQSAEVLSRQRKDAYLASDTGLEHAFDNQIRGLYKAIAIMTEEDKP